MTASRRLGKYEILEEVGRGGFAVVYKARDTTLDRVVALKVLHPQLTTDPKFIQRFQQEAQTAARLRHPHIVTIYEVGHEAGQHYLAMSYLPGHTLDERLSATRGPLPVELAISIVEQIADALDTIHQQGLVHRDIKPANVMVDSKGQATLLDFGIVRAAEGTRLTTSMTILGTPEYMAPEQADPTEVEEIDGRADVYALGVVAYEMLVGRPPFTGKSPTKVLYQHVHEKPPKPTTLNPSLPSGLEPILLKALAKQRKNRFQRAQTFAAQMRQSLLAKDRAPQRKSPPRRRQSRKIPTFAWVAGGAAALGLLISMIALRSALWPPPEATPLPSPVPSRAPTQQVTEIPTESPTEATPLPSPVPSKAPTQQVTEIPTEPPTEPPTPALGDTLVRSTDGMVMVYVPGGKFSMGSDADDVDYALQVCSEYRDQCRPSSLEDEQPVHDVTLDEFWIDRTEVTNGQYQKCVAAEACSPPKKSSSSTRESYYGNSAYDDYPVIYVSWRQADAYCEWVRARLPTEAEWEYAARGKEGHVYPWGNEFECSRGNFDDETKHDPYPTAVPGRVGCDEQESTAPVGHFEKGASWCGALDMAGNVWEWCSSLYMPYPYDPGDGREDVEAEGTRVLRGASWDHDPFFVRSANRYGVTLDWVQNDSGFRCAISTRE